MPDDPRARRIVVFGLGGTIAMTAAPGGGVTPAVSASELVAAVPGLADSNITVDVVDFRRMPGASLDLPDIADLIAAIDTALADGACGVVVTQGTDTIEETAYLADLWYRGDQPVVFTGAMRNPTLAGADGPANLLAAIQTASNPTSRGYGVLVVFADEIHAARRVRKTHATSVGTFQSPTGGPMGYVVEGEPRFVNRLMPRFALPRPTGSYNSPRVSVITAVLGDQGELISGAVQRLDGLVIAAMGAGHVPDRLVEALTDAAATIPTVLASRTGAGPVLTATYGFPGSERDLIDRGLIPAGFLDPLKARLLLYACLAADASQEMIIIAFGAAAGYRDDSHWPWHQDQTAVDVVLRP